MEYLNKMISDIATDFNAKKDQVIIDKLNELGVIFSFEEEKTRRFKRYLCEIDGNKETYYYNDGSIDGIRLVTFVRKTIPIDMENNVFSMGFEITYY